MEHAVLLKSTRVLDPQGPWHNQVVDVLLHAGQIADIAPTLDAPEATLLHAEGSCLSAGWVDGQAHFREPGEETKEGLSQGLKAASQGGFTAVAVLPSTHPCVDHAVAVRNLVATAERANHAGIPTQALPLACITEQAQGKQLAEMHDLSEAGAVAFTDDAPQDRVGVLQRALTYGKVHGKTIVDDPLDRDLNAGGLMHEGVVSTEMGLIGIPSEAETLRVARDLDVLKYAGGRLHLSILTTAAGVELVRQAKQAGLKVTCGTTALHLAYCDEDLRGFVGTLRVRSPFRSKADRDALRQGVLDGTVDVVISDHRPEDLEHHDVEFMLSPEGVASLPSAFALALSGLAEVSSVEEATAALVRALTSGPRHVLSLENVQVEKGAPCNVTWFHPLQAHVPHNGSRGVNLPPLKDNLHGQVLGVFRESRNWIAGR
jgi:dihydroorotase